MSTIQAEASKPQKKMQECNRCKAAGYANQMISFEKIGVDPANGKIRWKLIDESGAEHVHKSNSQIDLQSGTFYSKRKRIVDVEALTDLAEVRRFLSIGWEFKESYPATIANIPHYILVRRN
jgi:hypothetical protein